MNYVLDENGNIKIGKNGQPLVKGADGKEYELDAIGNAAKLETVTKESNERRKKLSEVTADLEKASGDNKSLQQQVDAIDDKSKVKINELKDEINSAWADKEKAWNNEKAEMENKLFDATTGVKFATSEVVKGLVLPPDIAKSTFGEFFKADGTAIDANGNPLYSKEKPGEYAEFDEALTMLVDARPDKDSLLKASGASGGGGHKSGEGEGFTENKTSLQNISEGLKSL